MPRVHESAFRAQVIAAEGPSFGAYLAGTAKDGEAIIFLNLLACLAVDRDPQKTTAEVLAHEVLHACQEIMGEALTESDIQNAMARIDGVEVGSCETEEQVIQETTRQLQGANAEIEKRGERIAELESVVKHVTEQRKSLASELAEARILLADLDEAVAARMATQGDQGTIHKLWETHLRVRAYLASKKEHHDPTQQQAAG